MDPLLQLAFLILMGGYLWRTALGALRSGTISVYVRANRDRVFSRRVNPAGYWIAVSGYLLFAVVVTVGFVMRILWY